MFTWRMTKPSNMALLIVLSVLLFTGGPAGAACLVDPTSFWELEESDGPFTDSAGTSTGVCGGTDTTACPSLNTGGRVGNAQSFDNSTTNEIDITGSSRFNWAVDGSFTIEFWILAPNGNIGANQVIVGRDDNTTNLHWWAGILDGPTDDVAAFITIPNTGGATTAPTLVGTTDITDGNWHHVVAVRDAENLKNYLYVDGVLEGSECITLGGDFQTTAPVNLGYMNYNNTPSFHYQGLLDEVAVYSEALSTTIISAHFSNGMADKTYCAAVAPAITTSDLPDAIIGYSYTADVEAIGNPAPAFALGGNEPEGMTFSNPADGIIDWKPIDSQAGLNVFTVTATAGVDSDSEDLAVTVKDVCDDLMISFWDLEEDGSGFGGADGFTDSAIGANLGYCDTSNTNPNWHTAGCPAVDSGGRVANGQIFNGVDDEILIGQRSDFNLAYDASFSIAVWMKAPDVDTSENDVLVGRDDSVNDLHWWVGIEDNGDVAAFALFPNNGGPTGPPSLLGTKDITDGQWHFIVAVRDAVNGKNLLYVDGVLEASECEDVVDGQDFSSDGYMTLGYMNFNGVNRFHFEGMLDEVAVFNTALPAAVVAQQFTDGDLSRGYCKTAPMIAGQGVVTIGEDTSREIVLADLTVTDVDSTWPDDFTLMVQDGVNYTRTGNTITPNLNFNGALTVNLQVHDGGYTSNTWPLSITVAPNNDAPGVSDIPNQTVGEGEAFTLINLDGYVDDAEDADSAITWEATGNTELTVTITDRVATITVPGVTWSGSETITFKAIDSEGLFAEDVATFTVTTGPVVSDIPDQTIVKGESFTAITLDDYVTDTEDADSAITWEATGNTELTVTITDRIVTVAVPDAEWTGTETVTFKATDTGGLFAEDAVVFTVNAESVQDSGGGGGSSGGSCFISTTGVGLFR